MRLQVLYRYNLPKTVVNNAINKLRFDDLLNKTNARDNDRSAEQSEFKSHANATNADCTPIIGANASAEYYVFCIVYS